MSNCTLTDEELSAKVEQIITKLCQTGGRSWSLRVPVDSNEDPDMVILELVSRFRALKPAMGTHS